jgi:hypothetical protein
VEENESAELPTVETRRARPTKSEIGWVLLGSSIGGLLSYMLVFSGWDPGSKADWFAGLGSFAAVAVALWQSVVIRRQADADAVTAAKRFAEELLAAEARSAAELAAQKQLARVERLYRHEREIKSALVEVARAVSEYGIVIASFWVESVDISKLPTRPEREVAFRPMSRMLGEAVSRIAIECDTAELLIEEQQLGEAVAELRVAVEAVVWAADEMRQRVERNDNPNMAPVHAAQLQMVEQATETRRLAWELLRTGVDGSEQQGGPT